MLIELFTWWQAQMRELLPASLRRSSSRTDRRALIAVPVGTDTPMMEFFARNGGRETPLGRHGAGGRDLRSTLSRLPRAQRKAVVLRIPPELMLEQTVVLPMAAEPELRQVLGYEMDRLTPFRAEDLLWTCRVERRDLARNRLHVRLTLVARTKVEPLLDTVRRTGLKPMRIEAGETAEARRFIPLVEDRPARIRLSPRMEACALGGCGALALAAISLPFIQQSVALSRLDGRIEAIKPQVAEVERLRGQIANSATTVAAIAAARKQVGDPLQSISLLTEVLPDDTYVTNLSFRQRKLTVSGRSAAAYRLIGGMAAHPLIRNPAFVAPVIRDETNGSQMFTIRLDLEP